MARYLITSALPYANGPIHFGHIAGVYLPADIYTRHRKMRGEKCIHISGSDEHGVAIMQNAEKAGVDYKDYVDGWHKEHREVFAQYGIHFDYFGQTSADYHADETVRWFKSLHDKGLIEKQAEEQLQCQSCHNYLPDRYVEGTCYECGYEEARGDECPNCGTWINAIKLINPVCKFCNSKEIETKSVDQWYLKLSKMHKQYREWFLSRKNWRKTVTTFVDSLTKDEMVDRAITRDLKWGIDVPLEEAKGKKLYVWFDAPIGYVSNTKKMLEEAGSSEDYLKDWWNNDETVLTNFIGKDNIIFHAIIFPCMSMGSGFAKGVDDLPANQYLNLEGKQFSKSKGWYVDAHKAIEEFGSDSLRYYLTTLIPETNDSSFTWSGFEARINGELANNIGNFVNRSLKFFHKNWPDGISAQAFKPFIDSDEMKNIQDFSKNFHEALNKVQIKKGLELIMKLGNDANTYFSDRAPWAEFKTDPDKAAETIAGASLYALVLGVYFKPYLPNLSAGILSYFDNVLDEAKASKIYRGEFEVLNNIADNGITLTGAPKGLVPKIDSDRIQALTDELKA